MNREHRKNEPTPSRDDAPVQRKAGPGPASAGRAPAGVGGTARAGAWEADAGLMSAMGLDAVQKKENEPAAPGAAGPAGGDAAAGAAAAGPAAAPQESAGDAEGAEAAIAAGGGRGAQNKKEEDPEDKKAKETGKAPPGADGEAAPEGQAGAAAAGQQEQSAEQQPDQAAQSDEAAQQQAAQEEQAAPEPEPESTEEPVQGKSEGLGGDVHAAAAEGISGGGGPLPHVDTIQRSFGHHDVSGVQAHTDGAAARGSEAMGAEAFATGNHVAFGGAPSLHTAAHEAAHIVQQRAGVHLKGGVGEAGDHYERHADAVADRVVQGKSATDLLDQVHPGGGEAGAGAGDGVQMIPREFIPTIAVTPAARPELKLYATHNQRFAISNYRTAPRGTSFHWGSGILGEALEYVSTTPSNSGATNTVSVKATKPGADSVHGIPTHQVPGGPLMMGEARHVRMIVPRPTLELLSMTKFDAAGAQVAGSTERLGVGEAVRYRVKVGNIDGAHMPSDGELATMMGGTGITNVQASTATQVQILPDGRTFDVTFRGVTIGPVAGTLELSLPGQTMGMGPSVPVNLHVEMDRGNFLRLCGNVNTAIDLADRRVTAWLASVSNAYAGAWRRHTDTLRDQDASNRLVGELILGAALAFIPGGIGGVLGEGMKRLTENNAFLVDGIKDLAKWGMRRAGAELGPGAAPAMRAYPPDPLQWQNAETTRVQTELAVATQRLLDWQTKAGNSDPDFFCEFDPMQAMESSLTVGGQRAATLAPVDGAQSAIDFEKGFWARWLEMYAYEVQSTPSKAGMHHSSRENNGKKIKERCETIGLDWRAHAAVSERAVEAEVERRRRARGW